MVSSDHVKPGEKGKISAKIDITGRAGLITKNIQVYSNDPKRHSITLTLSAMIR